MNAVRPDTSASPSAASGERNLTLRRDGSGVWSVTSEALLGADGRLAILHRGESYQLRVTRQNKLILTK